jgi:hypothetical protein
MRRRPAWAAAAAAAFTSEKVPKNGGEVPQERQKRPVIPELAVPLFGLHPICEENRSNRPRAPAAQAPDHTTTRN